MVDISVVRALAEELAGQVVADRRDFHRYPELGWSEFRTGSLVARRLTKAGWEVQLGRQVHDEAARMGVPSEDELAAEYERALRQGADAEFIRALRGGYTGVVGSRRFGEGPTIGLRVDMDALPIQEACSEEHRPYREGFVSQNPGIMHACGHDAHTAIGLALAEALPRLGASLPGKVKLIFQPAEEGVRGARSMVEAGIVDDVDLLLGIHVYTGWKLGEMIAGTGGYAATRKFDVRFEGKAAHAGSNPQQGRNALLAAANAVLNLYAISRHAEGLTRVNVGRLEAGAGRNMTPAEAWFMAETRGATTELNEYMYRRALEVIEGAAKMYGCGWSVREMGAAESAMSDADLSARIRRAAETLGGYTFLPLEPRGGSEDFTYMMRRVQARGGQAAGIALGADPLGISRRDPDRERVRGGHTSLFDIDEAVLPRAIELLLWLICDLLG
ncbi:MAG: amidohydrolase [Chloroflexi bacterium]|nr:amidohydrolase [Chloroflexota bacterium]